MESGNDSVGIVEKTPHYLRECTRPLETKRTSSLAIHELKLPVVPEGVIGAQSEGVDATRAPRSNSGLRDNGTADGLPGLPAGAIP